jgi:hypothetical protein
MIHPFNIAANLRNENHDLNQISDKTVLYIYKYNIFVIYYPLNL